LTKAGYFHSFIAVQQNAVPEGYLAAPATLRIFMAGMTKKRHCCRRRDGFA
jgi:hypothetical protein